MATVALPLSLGSAPLGRVRVPGSKSVSNRALLLGALAPGRTVLTGVLEADDTLAMRRSLAALGFVITHTSDGWSIDGGNPPVASGPLDVGASGTTLRFLLPWLALSARAPVEFVGDPRLFVRPLQGLVAALESFGATFEFTSPSSARLVPAPRPPDGLELFVGSSASSQFVSGLAMAAAALSAPSVLRFGEVPSHSYLGLTVRWLRRFGVGVDTEWTNTWRIPGGCLAPCAARVPGDWSGAAAFLAAGLVTGRPVSVGPLDPDDGQGDRAIVEALKQFGGSIGWGSHSMVEVTGTLSAGADLDLSTCPDLAPVLAAVAALAPAPSVLRGLGTLPAKESDRLERSIALVEWAGGRAHAEAGSVLFIRPGRPPSPDRAPFNPHNDHRMAFAAAVVGLKHGGAVLDADCVAKTLPEFWADWDRMVGGR